MPLETVKIPTQPLGILYGVGVGPGDPELITLKALRLIKTSPVVAFPAGTDGRLGIAQEIVAGALTANQIQLPLKFPYVQDPTILSQAWNAAAEKVWTYLQQGLNVVFASEGDVSFYSTFTYLAQTLQQQQPTAQIQIVPGICSPMAAAASLGIPLTVQAQRLIILPALYTVEDLSQALNWAEVVVLLKVSSVYPKVWAILQAHQLLEQSYIVEKATQPSQVIYSGLGDRPDLKLSYFSILVVQTNVHRTC